MKNKTIYRKNGRPDLLYDAYDLTLNQWKVPVESLFVKTRFGRTHILVAGPSQGEPLLLFHGFAFSATMWGENVQALSERYRVFAVDFIGDVNKSEMKVTINNAKDCVDWFSEILDRLGLHRVHIGGHSYGGFVAMLLASDIPERIDKLLVLSPGGGFQPQSKIFFLKCLIIGAFPSTPRIEKFMNHMTGKGNTINRTLKDQFIVAMQQALPRNRLYATNMSDEVLSRISAPMLLLIGDQDIQYNPELAVQRAKKIIPTIDAHVVPNAGHGLPLEQPVLVNKMMIDFLRK